MRNTIHRIKKEVKTAHFDLKQNLTCIDKQNINACEMPSIKIMFMDIVNDLIMKKC